MAKRRAGRNDGGGPAATVRCAVLCILLGVIALPYLLHFTIVVPPGIHYESPSWPVSTNDVRLLTDSTGFDDAARERIVDQQIFTGVLEVIREAQTFVFLDLFLWNGWNGAVPARQRALSSELAQALIRKKTESPDTVVLVLTDPINRVYGRGEEPFYGELAAAGITVVFTDLLRLRDPNFVYSAPVRVYGPKLNRVKAVRAWLEKPRFEHPFDYEGGAPVNLRQTAVRYMFKANHRSVVIADSSDGEWRMIVTGMNPADADSAHSNLGLLVRGYAAVDAARTELAAVEWSAADPANVLAAGPGSWREAVQSIRSRMPPRTASLPREAGKPFVQWLTEGAVRERVLRMLDNADRGDEIRIAMFRISDKEVIRSIRDAAYGGAGVRLILDANHGAFGKVRNGLPNRPVAAGLVAFAREEGLDLQVRWASTRSEQFHFKAISVTGRHSRKSEFMCGSANWTRRSLQDFNMEADVYCGSASWVNSDFDRLFDDAWNNAGGLILTEPYDRFAETGWVGAAKMAIGYCQELSGMCRY